MLCLIESSNALLLASFSNLRYPPKPPARAKLWKEWCLLETPLTLQEITRLYRTLTAGEKWSGRLYLEVSRQILRPHLVFYPDDHTGRVRIPPHHDRLVVASWIAHESGHFEWFQENQSPAFLDWLEDKASVSSIPLWQQKFLRNFAYLWFWRLRLREELYAHSVELRLLKKAGVSLDAVQRGDLAIDELTPTTVRNGPIQRWYQRTMQRRQNSLTQEAMT